MDWVIYGAGSCGRDVQQVLEAGIDAGGSSSVPVVALDDALCGVAVSVLKLDIEGAEPDALEGARDLIARRRPCLAVCLYHHAAHVWELPQMIDSWGLGYQFALRAHAANGFDWVLYAVPQ